MNVMHGGDVSQDVEQRSQDYRQSGLAGELRHWLASGVCQSPSGAFYAWRDAETGAPSFEYPEITGYALTHFAGRAVPMVKEMTAGSRAADWLVTRLTAQDLSARASWDASAIYNFDLAMIATGLLLFGRRTGVGRYTAQGLSLVRSLQQDLHGENGLSAISVSHPVPSGRSTWSTEGQAHLLKVVQCFLVADTFGLLGADSSAALLIEQRKELQRDNGRFVTHPSDRETMLHPHLYAVEGLWMWGTARNDTDAIARARKGLEWAWGQQLQTGGFPRSVSSSGAEDDLIEQSDVTSQAIRMALVLNPALPGIDAALTQLRQTAVRDGEGAALVYQPSAPQAHQNVWVTLFGAQALDMAEAGARMLDWQRLV